MKATSCGGIIIFRGKVLLLYKSYKNKYNGWVLPKGTMEENESMEETALREVKEEAGATPQIMAYLGNSSYSFRIPEGNVEKEVHWFLMKSNNYYNKPQSEEYFQDSGYYKYHEAWHLLKFQNEKKMLEAGFQKYNEMKKNHAW